MSLVRRSRRAGIAIIVALSMVVLIMAMALALDVGFARSQQAQLEAVVDAAALAGASALPQGADVVRQRAIMMAATNTVGGEPLVLVDADIEIGRWDGATFTVDEGNGDAVRIALRQDVAVTFAAIGGFDRLVVARESIALGDLTQRGTGCGFFGADRLDISGNVQIDSYDSTVGSYGGGNENAEAGACSNGPMRVNGSSVEIWGDAAPGPGETLQISGSPSISGSTEALDESVEPPEVDMAAALATNDNASVGWTTDTEVQLSGQQTKAIGPGTFYVKALRVSGQAQLVVTPPVSLYVQEDAQISGKGVVNTGQDPHDLTIYSLGNEFQLSGNADFYGAVVAPNAQVQVSGTAEYFGMIVGGTSQYSGTIRMHMDESLPLMFGMVRPRPDVPTVLVK